MYPLEKVKDEIGRLLSREISLEKKEIVEILEMPDDSRVGDIAFPCFRLAKELKKNPNDTAEDLSKKLKVGGLLAKAKSVGPYLNFFLDRSEFAKESILRVLEEEKNYGRAKSKKETVVIEFPSPNTNKPLHVGHLRNLIFSESVSRLLESQGVEVKRVNLNNDRGIHICKSMLAYSKWGENQKPDKKSDHFVGDFYVKYAQEEVENPDLIKEAQEVLRNWERGERKAVLLWKTMNGWALSGFDETFKRFGAKFDKQYYESKTYLHGKEMVQEGLQKNLFYKTSNGAIAVDLGGELGEKVLLRSDGTSVYVTQDMYLAEEKYRDFKPKKSIIVTANEQIYHFKVLFKILELLKKPYAPGLHHLSYGMVRLPSGKMKSREGTVIDADDLLDEVVKLVQKEIVKRGGERDDKRATKIALSAIKYFILKFAVHKDFTFYPQESISLEGNTGPYLQYSFVRAKKILDKGGKVVHDVDFSLLQRDEVFDIVKKIALFPKVVERAAENYSPNILAEYAFQLASLLSRFYEQIPVLKADKKERDALLKFLEAYSNVIGCSLDLLGIDTIDEM